MEETFVKIDKSKGGTTAGIICLTQNYEAYQRWVRTSHERVKYVEKNLNMADMKQSDDVRSEHRELRPSVIQRSEDSVQRMMNAIESFTNPFSVEPGKLINLSSGAAVSAEVEPAVL